MVAVSEPVDVEPLTDLLPVHPPEAVQELALAALQFNIELAPLATVTGLAERSTVTLAGVVTVTETDCLAVPPGPVQFKTYVAAALRAAVGSVPLVALEPLQEPEAVQEVASVELHVNVALLPLTTVLGLTLRLTVGIGATTPTEVLWVAEPPGPAQLIL